LYKYLGNVILDTKQFTIIDVYFLSFAWNTSFLVLCTAFSVLFFLEHKEQHPPRAAALLGLILGYSAVLPNCPFA